MLDVDEASGGEPALCCQPLDAACQLLPRKRRIEKDQVERLRRTRQILLGLGLFQLRLARRSAPVTQQRAERGQRLPVTIDEDAGPRAARQPLEPERTRAGVRDEAAAAAGPPLHPVEQCVA